MKHTFLLVLFLATNTAFASITDPLDVPGTTTYTDETIYIVNKAWTISGTLYLNNTDVYINSYEVFVQAGGSIVLSNGSRLIGNGNNPDLRLGGSHVIQGAGYFDNMNISVPNGNWQILAGDEFTFNYGGSFAGTSSALIYVQGRINFYGNSDTYYFDGWDEIISYDYGWIGVYDDYGTVTLSYVPDIRQWGSATTFYSYSGSTVNRHEVRMAAGESIGINGIFTCTGTDFTGIGGLWNGVAIVNASSESHLTYCRLEDVDMVNSAAIVYYYNCGDNHSMNYCHLTGSSVAGKAVRLYAGSGYTAKLTMTCCILDDSWYGATSDGNAELHMSQCLVDGNVTGVIAGNGGYAYLLACCIDNNQSHGLSVNGGAVMHVKDCTLDGNADATSGVLYATGSGSIITNYISGAYYPSTVTGSNVMAFATNGGEISMHWCYWGTYPTSPTYFSDDGGTGTIDCPNPRGTTTSDGCFCAYAATKTAAQTALDITNPDIVDAYCYPNPFNPTTTITYKIADDVPVTLNVFTMTGELVETLVDETQMAGTYSVTFDPGNTLSSGVYFYELSTPIGSRLGKMILQK